MYKNVKTALIVEGGGMRGIFSAGVLDSFGRLKFDPFDIYLGVSAGACNLASHLAGQYERNRFIVEKWSSTSRFISLPRFLTGGHYMDLDWLWDVTIREYRLDLDHIFRVLGKGDKEYIIVGTSMVTGAPMYLNPDKENLEHYLKVSSALPFLFRDTPEVNGEKAADGGIADSIPVIEACRRGARRIVVIRSRPEQYVKHESMLSFLYPVLFRKYPGLAEVMKKRHKSYMEAVNFIKNPPRGVSVWEISPSINSHIKRTTKDRVILASAYFSGIKAGENFVKNTGGLASAYPDGNIIKN